MHNKEDLGEENLGKQFFEGDMMLTPEQEIILNGLKKRKSSESSSDASKRALLKNPKSLWKNGKVSYWVDDAIDKKSKNYINKAIAHWEKMTCLKFNKTKSVKDYILFVFEGGCASMVGRVGGMQKITIGSLTGRCTVGNIIHELGHAVGFFHEQSRPDRDRFVRIIWKNIIPWYVYNFRRFNDELIDSRNVPFDCCSIMMYGESFFSKYFWLLPTIVAIEQECAHHPPCPRIGQRNTLSKLDVIQANLLYRCDGKSRLTNKEREELEKSLNDDAKNVGCSEPYSDQTCLVMKKRGYCQKFPRTMRETCGITCNFCSNKRGEIDRKD